MSEFLALTIAGIASYGCVYALGALGLVVTYTTSGVFNFAQGAVGMIGAFAYWQLVEVWHWPAWAALVAVAAVAAPALGAFLGQMRWPGAADPNETSAKLRRIGIGGV